MDFVQGEVHAKCTGGLVRCSPRHKMVIPRHVVFLAVGCGRRRKKVHVTRNDHVVPRRTTNKTLCALRPPSPSGKSIPPPLMTDIWKISLRKKSQPPKCERTNFVSSPDLIAPPYRSPSTGVGACTVQISLTLIIVKVKDFERTLLGEVMSYKSSDLSVRTRGRRGDGVARR